MLRCKSNIHRKRDSVSTTHLIRVTGERCLCAGYRNVPIGATSFRSYVMRNTKLILAMLAGCMAMSGAAFAQDASQKADPTPAAKSGTPTQTSSDTMKSTHTKKAHTKKAASGDTSAPAKSSSSGM